MLEASHRWYRHDYEAIERHCDGVTLASAGLSPTMTTIAKMLPRPSAAFCLPPRVSKEPGSQESAAIRGRRDGLIA